jgi:hypothetical protein
MLHVIVCHVGHSKYTQCILEVHTVLDTVIIHNLSLKYIHSVGHSNYTQLILEVHSV